MKNTTQTNGAIFQAMVSEMARAWVAVLVEAHGTVEAALPCGLITDAEAVTMLVEVQDFDRAYAVVVAPLVRRAARHIVSDARDAARWEAEKVEWAKAY